MNPSDHAEEGALELDVYGLKVHIEDSAESISSGLRLDYAWFARPRAEGFADLEIVITDEPPDLRRYAGARATSIGSRSVLYRWNDLFVTDMGGRAMMVYEPGRRQVRVSYKDESLAYEALYLFLHDKVNAHLEKIGLVRIHALALTGRDGAATVLMLPSGGGKTTLALQALESDEVKLLSEDAALIDRNGIVHPFPLRLGLSASDAPTETEGGLRRIELTQSRPKVAIEVEHFRDRVADRPGPLRHLVVGRRVLSNYTALQKARRRDAVGTLIREDIVGAGLYQGLRFLHENERARKVEKLRSLTGRAIGCAAFLRRAQVWKLDLGMDYESNWDALRSLLVGRA